MIENFITRGTKTFRKAIAIKLDECEKNRLEFVVERLATWAANKLWDEGYDAKSFELFMQEFDCGHGFGYAISIDAKRKDETVRQFCYQFVKLAEAIKKENDLLTTETEYLRKKISSYKEKIKKLKKRN